jgi:hypothetical protein
MRFAPDGRCREFHEFYMLEGTPAATSADA